MKIILLPMVFILPVLNAATIVNFTGDGSNGSSAPSLSFTPWAQSGADNVRHAAYNGALNSAPTDADGLPVLHGAAYHASIGGGAANHQPTLTVSTASGGAQPQPERLRIGGSRGSFDNLQRVMLAVEKADFLGGVGTTPLTFGSGDSLSIEVSGSGNGNVQSINFLVRDGSTWFISQAFGSGLNILTLADPGAANWSVFSADASNNFLGIDTTNISGTTRTFSDIQAVGFFVQQTWPASGTNNGQTDIRNWTVSVSPIPEPTVPVMLGSLIVLASLRRRR